MRLRELASRLKASLSSEDQRERIRDEELAAHFVLLFAIVSALLATVGITV